MFYLSLETRVKRQRERRNTFPYLIRNSFVLCIRMKQLRTSFGRIFSMKDSRSYTRDFTLRKRWKATVTDRPGGHVQKRDSKGKPTESTESLLVSLSLVFFFFFLLESIPKVEASRNSPLAGLCHDNVERSAVDRVNAPVYRSAGFPPRL